MLQEKNKNQKDQCRVISPCGKLSALDFVGLNINGKITAAMRNAAVLPQRSASVCFMQTSACWSRGSGLCVVQAPFAHRWRVLWVRLTSIAFPVPSLCSVDVLKGSSRIMEVFLLHAGLWTTCSRRFSCIMGFFLALSQMNVPRDDESSLFHQFACLLNAQRSIFAEQPIPSSLFWFKKQNEKKAAIQNSRLPVTLRQGIWLPGANGRGSGLPWQLRSWGLPPPFSAGSSVWACCSSGSALPSTARGHLMYPSTCVHPKPWIVAGVPLPDLLLMCGLFTQR